MFRKLLTTLAALAMLATPLAFATAGPAAADTASQCAGGNPGYENHVLAYSFGVSGVFLDTIAFHWQDDCHKVTLSFDNLSHATDTGFTDCGLLHYPDGSISEYGPNGRDWSTQDYRQKVAFTGYSCNDPNMSGWSGPIVGAYEQYGDGVGQDDMIFVYENYTQTAALHCYVGGTCHD